MWFIVIFGSLPTIRTVLLSAGRTITSTFTGGHSKVSSKRRSTYSKDKNNWMELDDQRFEAKINSNGKAVLTKSGMTDSQDEVDGMSGHGMFIMRETTVDVAHEYNPRKPGDFV